MEENETMMVMRSAKEPFELIFSNSWQRQREGGEEISDNLYDFCLEIHKKLSSVSFSSDRLAATTCFYFFWHF
jgi:hypothetical protein